MKIFAYLLAAAAFATGTPAHADPAAPSKLVEEFNDVSLLPGWSQVNRSTPPGQGWFAGNAGIFPAQAGDNPGAYIAANYLSAASDGGTIDLWLVTPVVNFAGTLSFYLRSAGGFGFADTVELLFGRGTSADPDNFTLLIDSIAPGSDWTRYEYTGGLGEGRFAFRYTGPAATSNYIGLDTVQMIPVPEPATWAMLCTGLAFICLRRRRAALLLAMAGLMASPGSHAAQEAPPPAPGVIVVRDTQTGKLRAPTAAEYKALAKVAQPAQRGIAPLPATIKRADGALQRRLGESGMTYSVISRDKDGQLRIDCVQGADAAQQATQQPREDGYEDR